jgi:hypothetical protein
MPRGGIHEDPALDTLPGGFTLVSGGGTFLKMTSAIEGRKENSIWAKR